MEKYTSSTKEHLYKLIIDLVYYNPKFPSDGAAVECTNNQLLKKFCEYQENIDNLQDIRQKKPEVFELCGLPVYQRTDIPKNEIRLTLKNGFYYSIKIK